MATTSSASSSRHSPDAPGGAGKHSGGGARHQQAAVSSTSKLSTILAKAATPKAEWTNKDELLDVVYWQRQILSAVLGLAWGLLPLKGIIGLALFFLVNCAAVYFYTCVFQGVDEEEYGGLGEILKEGLMTSFASFLVLWIVVYDHFHAGDLLGSAASSVVS